MTKADVIKMNEGCANGFEFDLWHYMTHKEKEIKKDIPMGENKYLRVGIIWTEHREKRTNAYGQSYPVYTGMYEPQLHFSMWYKEDNGFDHSYGLGYFKTIGQPVSRRNFKALQKMSKDYDTEKLLKMYEAIQKEKVNLMK